MYDPVSTYRIQFHKGFTFDDFNKIIPYLHRLGIKTIYASPVFRAVPGSMHGYDVTDPLSINPEIGTLGQLRAISKKLKKLGIGWLQDIVPNHMAFHTSNAWLMDVLEKGRRSVYSNFFDILWDNPVAGKQLMVPFLGEQAKDALAQGKIKIVYHEKKLSLIYFDQHYPLRLESYAELLRHCCGKNAQKIIAKITRTTKIKGGKAFSKASGRLLKHLAQELHDLLPPRQLEKINGNVALLSSIVNSQHYRLCYWQDTNNVINYRRFFTVNRLICLNMQHETVFNEYHRLIKRLIDDGIFQGLRADHIDGLYDPDEYLRRLRHLAGADTYIAVEKILENGEQVPSDWPIQGTTGYDFLAMVNNLLTNRQSKRLLSDLYKSMVKEQLPVKEQIIQKKEFILQNYMQGDLDNLYRLFRDLRLADKEESAGIGPELFKESIAGILIRYPFYRSYGNTMPLPEEDAQLLRALLVQLSEAAPTLCAINIILENCLLHKPKFADEQYKKAALAFYMRLMQFTGPLMAKGVEDTLMYSYNRFIDHNEVGDSPESFGLEAADFHRLMQQRAGRDRQSMNATATHDTKRGEDTRARLNVLSDIAQEWAEEVKKWQVMNAGLKTGGFPDANDEYFIYQSLAGAFPMPGMGEKGFISRLQEYLIKALRESKTNSNWASPDNKYEGSVKKFTSGLLNKRGQFWKVFEPFYARIADLGIVNSLSQVLLKYTCPGVPDLYQGCERWDLSFVDPDNRRPINYQLMDSYANDGDWQQLWKLRYDGRVKQALVASLLKLRANNIKVFSRGDYIPLQAEGKYSGHVLSFARRWQQEWLVTIVTLHHGVLMQGDDPCGFDWGETRILLPDGAPMNWENLLTGEKNYAGTAIELKKVFGLLPIALLRLEHDRKHRGAGILMHISSLPSSFGIGDMGPLARSFTDFLYRSRQRYWQLLPVNPVNAASGFSPYSATSSFAGNVLFISPEMLAEEGLLSVTDIKKHVVQTKHTDYAKAIRVKSGLLKTAWTVFSRSADAESKRLFEKYKETETDWLDDFAIYQFLKDKHKDDPWYHWPEKYKFREKGIIGSLQEDHQVEFIRWQQFIFDRQWRQLRAYCTSKGVQLFGDMPFYTSYDSADVWANPGYFKIDSDGNPVSVAGVPPDYFSATGQLWGMPVYNWESLKASGYHWWIKRIKRNLGFFDLIRLDHFRAFSAYWEIPGGSEKAVNGSWQTGPGTDFFDALQAALGELPFVAEDLGDIDDKVYQLRDRYGFPGMHVLQFAFDETMPVSEHIPHNYTINSIAYTGTHDNNTTKGWYQHDAGRAVKDRVEKYLGKKISAGDIHEKFIALAYASVAKMAIIPMQDIIGLGRNSRMNLPSSPKGNWAWRLEEMPVASHHEKFLEKLAELFNR